MGRDLNYKPGGAPTRPQDSTDSSDALYPDRIVDTYTDRNEPEQQTMIRTVEDTSGVLDTKRGTTNISTDAKGMKQTAEAGFSVKSHDGTSADYAGVPLASEIPDEGSGDKAAGSIDEGQSDGEGTGDSSEGKTSNNSE